MRVTKREARCENKRMKKKKKTNCIILIPTGIIFFFCSQLPCIAIDSYAL